VSSFSLYLLVKMLKSLFLTRSYVVRLPSGLILIKGFYTLFLKLKFILLDLHMFIANDIIVSLKRINIFLFFKVIIRNL